MNLQEFLTLLSETEDQTRQGEILEQHRELLNKEFIEQGTQQVEAWTKEGRHAEALRLSEGLVTACTVTEELSQLRGKALVVKAEALDSMRRWDDAMEVYAEARRLFENAKDREGIADCDLGQGRIYFYRGDFDKALACYKKAQAVFEKLGKNERAADCVMNQGATHGSRGEFYAAMMCFKRAQAIFEDLGIKDKAAGCVMNQGNEHNSLGEFDTALACYKQAQVVFEQLGIKDRVADCLINQGVVHNSLGEFDKALSYYKQAQAIFEELGIKDRVAHCVMNRSVVHDSLGEFDTALACYKRAQAIFEELGIKGRVADCVMNQGVVHYFIGEFDTALACYKRAQAIFEDLGVKDMATACVMERGNVYLSRREYDEALACYQQAQEVFEELGMKDRAMEALRGKGDVYRLIEKRDAALQCYTQAKEERPIGELWYPEIQWQVRYGIAKIFSSTRQALDHYDESIAIIDTLRRRQQTDWTKMGILYNKEGVYAETILWCLEQRHEASPSPGLSLRGRGGYEVDYLPKAFDYTERAKARALLDLIDQTQPVLKSEDAKVQTHLNILRQHQTEQQRRREAEKFSEAAELSTDIQQQQEEMAELSFEDASLTVGRVRDIETIQKALPEDGALVEFYYQGETQVAFLLTNKNLQAFHLQLDTVLPKLPRLRQAIQGREPLDDVQATLVELFNVLFKQSGIWNNLEGFERLILVPHGELHGVPFAALYDKEGGQYLIEQKILSVVPSASILDVCRLKNSNRRQESCLWVYAPQTKPESKLSSMDKDMKRYGKPYDGLSEMFNELQTVTGTEATIEGITALLSERPWNVVHFYCHAKAHLDNPMLSFIELSDTSGGTPRAAFLQAKDIFNLPMKNASLAVLGACETAVGARRPGDDIVSLTRAFFRAGTPSVLASLWRVPARETAKLLKNFYLGGNSGWLSGVDQAVALQSAQQEIIVEGRHPYYWAGFVLYGDWS